MTEGRKQSRSEAAEKRLAEMDKRSGRVLYFHGLGTFAPEDGLDPYRILNELPEEIPTLPRSEPSS